MFDSKPDHHHHHHPFPQARVQPHLSTQHTTSKVDPHVLGNITLCLETLATNITLELPQASVSEGVLVEIRNGKELFPTLFTFIIPNTAVC